MIPGEAAMQHCGSGGRRNGSIYAHSEAVMPCSCSLFQDVDCGPGTFSIFFATSATNEKPPEDGDPSCGSYSAVDCTLSLGTPSTRHQSQTISKPSPISVIQNQQRSNRALPWDLMAPSQPKQSPASASAGAGTSILRAGAGGGGLKLGGDHLLARRCANCDTTSTPLWRNGPRGPKSLCNACGIRYKKEERRAGSTTATLPSTCSSSSLSAMSAATHMEPPLAQHHQQQQHLGAYDYYQNPWYHSAALQTTTTARKTAQTPTFISAISTVDDGSAMEGAAALPFLSWRLNVAAAPHPAEFVPSLVHDCT